MSPACITELELLRMVCGPPIVSCNHTHTRKHASGPLVLGVASLGRLLFKLLAYRKEFVCAGDTQ
jgi:hypothetical protein